MRGVLDENHNLQVDGREAFDTVRLAPGKTAAGELWAFVHDTTPPRIREVTVIDSTSASIQLSQQLAPGQRIAPNQVTVRILPDSTPIRGDVGAAQAAGRQPQSPRGRGPGHDRAGHHRARHDQARHDGRRYHAARRAAWPRPGAPGQPRGRTELEPLTSRPPLTDQLILRVPQPWKPEGRYEVEIRAVRSVSGVTGDVRGGMTVKPVAAPDTTRAARRRLAQAAAAQNRRRLGQTAAAEEALMTDRRRELPSVDRLLREPAVDALLLAAPRAAVVAAIRETLAAARTRRAGPPEDWATEIRERLAERTRPGLRPVLNATGVVLHTNLGRAPLAATAVEAMAAIAAGYSNLELDLDTGTRGSRTDHCRERLRRADRRRGRAGREQRGRRARPCAQRARRRSRRR